MHEKALMDDLVRELERVAQEHGGERVVAVSVHLGALSHFTEDHFREHFVAATLGTVAEGARVEARLGTAIDDPRAQGVVLEHVELRYPTGSSSQPARALLEDPGAADAKQT